MKFEQIVECKFIQYVDQIDNYDSCFVDIDNKTKKGVMLVRKGSDIWEFAYLSKSKLWVAIQYFSSGRKK